MSPLDMVRKGGRQWPFLPGPALDQKSCWVHRWAPAEDGEGVGPDSNSDTTRQQEVTAEVLIHASISLVWFAQHPSIHSFNNSAVRELLSPLLYRKGN